MVATTLAVPSTPLLFPGIREYDDRRLRAYLFDVDEEGSLTALLLPNQPGSHAVATFVSYLADTALITGTLPQPSIEFHRTDEATYGTIQSGDRTAIIPYKTKDEFPFKVLDRTWTSHVEECNGENDRMHRNRRHDANLSCMYGTLLHELRREFAHRSPDSAFLYAGDSKDEHRGLPSIYHFCTRLG